MTGRRRASIYDLWHHNIIGMKFDEKIRNACVVVSGTFGMTGPRELKMGTEWLLKVLAKETRSNPHKNVHRSRTRTVKK